MILVPKSLSDFLTRQRASGAISVIKADRLAVVFSLISSQYYGRDEFGNIKPVPMPQQYFEFHLNNRNDIPAERRILKDAGFIFYDAADFQFYSEQNRTGYCRSYRINDEHLESVVQWKLGNSVTHKLDRHRKKCQRQKFDCESNTEYEIRQVVQSDILDLNLMVPDFYHTPEAIEDAKTLSVYNSIRRLKEGHVIATWGRKGGRLFHPIANLRKDLRLNLRHDGESLEGIDICSSLIYFLAHCSGDEDLLLDTTEEDFYRITQNRLGDKYDRDLIKITLLQWLFDDLREDKPAKTKLDIRVGEKATLTECIQRVEVCSQYRSSQIIRGCNRADENAEEFDYVKCKLNMSEAAVKSVVRKNYNKLFKKHYPIAWGYIEKVKSNNETTLAAELQRAESDLMIRKVIPALVQANVRPIIPIHDSLLTRRSNLKKLREVTNTVMKREGHKPKFDIGV